MWIWIHTVALALVLLSWFTRTLGLWLGWRRTPRLGQIDPDGPEPLPRLSIIAPALNEEAAAESAMRTLLALDYPDLEIVAVDDRSTDGTGAILDRLAAGNGRLSVVHVKALPAGWLGKNHAMHLAATATTGEWILFTDADVHFEATALRRALRHALARRADHLVVLPEVITRGFWENLFLGFFWTIFAFRWQPRKVSDPRSRAYIGIGAFNLVRREAYRRAGGHAALRMEVLDDLKLGKKLKRTGSRQECIPSGGLVRVRWVSGLRGAVESLTKNVFAALHFNPLWALGAAILILGGTVWPAAGLFFGPWGTRLLSAATFGCMVWSTRAAAQTRRLSPLYGLGFPLAGVIMVYIVFRSAIRTCRQGGIVWRGTHYPLSDLRKGIV